MEITGPISTLPNSHHIVPSGVRCDNHADRPATVRIQGETDSMGAELHDLCDECHEDLRAEVLNADTSGCCDWCNNHALKLVKTRDFDEGLSGRLYDVCVPCLDAYNKKLYADMDDWD